MIVSRCIHEIIIHVSVARNVRGDDRLFVSGKHSSYSYLEGLYEGEGSKEPSPINPELTQGMAGNVWCDSCVINRGG